MEVPQEKIDTAIATLKEKNENFTIQESNSAEMMLRDEETFQIVMMLAIVIIVLISMYVIASLSKLIISERMPVLATFRSVGANKGMMNFILLLEFFVYGFVGAILGIIFALLLLPFAADMFNEYKDYGIETIVNYNPLYIAIAIVFGMFFPVLISFFRIIKTNNKPLKEILFDSSLSTHKRSKWSTVFGLILLVLAFVLHMVNEYDGILLAAISLFLLFISIVLLMPIMLNGLSTLLRILFRRSSQGEQLLGIKNIANNKIVANNVSMIMVVFLLLIMIGIASNGIDQFVSRTLSKDFDVAVSLPVNDTILADEIIEMEGLSDTYIQHVSLGMTTINGIENAFAVYGIRDFNEVDDFFDGVTYLEVDYEKLKSVENAILMDEYFMDKYSIEIGDTISIQPVDLQYNPLEGSQPIKMVVAGKMNSAGFSSSRDSIFVPMQIYEKEFANSFRELVLKLESGYTAEEVKETIIDKYSNQSLEVVTFDEMIGSQKATIDTLIDGITVTIGLGMIVGILGISNNLMVSFHQRKKEYAVLYSVCMSKGQIIKMVCSEMLITLLSVIIIGLAGGLALNILLTKFLHAVGMVTEFHFTFELFGVLCLVVAILLSLSTLTLIRNVFKLNIMKELRYE